MRKEKSRRSWKKELDYDIGEELKEKRWKILIMKRRRAGDHGGKGFIMKQEKS